MELLGMTEIAQLAGVSRAAVANWVIRDPSFPKPVADLACGSIWLKPDIVNWLGQNKHIANKDDTVKDDLAKGQLYTHDFICSTFGGDAKGGAYLVQSQQRILCGCFTKDMNPPDVPERVLIGNRPRVIKKAERMEQQGGIIPIFLKQGVNQWRYMGRYAFERFSRDPADFEKEAAEVGRVDIVGVLSFRPVSES